MLLFYGCGNNSSGTKHENKYTVTLKANPTDGGTVKPAHASYKAGTELDIQATPSDGYIFKDWSGDFDGTNKKATIKVDGNKTITANFTRKKYDLTVDTTGKGSVDQKVIEDNTSSSRTYPGGTKVQLDAHPATGWKFDHWEGDLSGSDNPAVVTVKGAMKVTAVFTQTGYDLTVHAEHGAIKQEIVENTASTSRTYKSGTKVKLTANPDKGYDFDHWKGDLSGTDNPQTITMDTAKTVTAVFKGKEVSLNISTEGSGSVSKDPDSTKYQVGSVVKLTAKPSNDYKFSKWKGTVPADSSTNNPLFYEVGADNNNITTVFTEVSQNKPAGQGTEADPYQIASLDNLKWVSSDSSSWDAYFKQTQDIDASSTQSWNNGKGFVPIGNTDTSFTGTYDGQGHTITGLYINHPPQQGYVGFFGVVAKGAVIENVHLSEVDITGGRDTGGLAGISSGMIQNAEVSQGQIEGAAGAKAIGGLVGSNKGTIKGSQANVDVTADGVQVGGLAGWSAKGSKIVNSHATGDVTTTDQQVGGLVGAGYATIDHCYATGDVKTTNGASSISETSHAMAGGLVGYQMGGNNSIIKSSFATGDAIGYGTYVAGLVGDNQGDISNSYATGNAKGHGTVGGLTGATFNNVTVENCYSTGKVTAKTKRTGGLAAKLGGPTKVKNSYWDTETSGQSSSVGGTGLKTNEMQGTNAKTNMTGFKFSTIWYTQSGDYPKLRDNPPPSSP
jgi:hypothetical protein